MSSPELPLYLTLIVEAGYYGHQMDMKKCPSVRIKLTIMTRINVADTRLTREDGG